MSQRVASQRELLAGHGVELGPLPDVGVAPPADAGRAVRVLARLRRAA